ncbi:MAG: transcription elongation factor GreA [Clostridia bacterium]|nr:transcription elongation factor GreA [Clostridia bacterium]MBR1585620.1 transcription elongation factor GreA [Clostridia bacterium]
MSEMHEHSNKTVVSAEGMRKMEEKLQYLTTTRRAEVAEQISIARGFGDLSENAEYDEAKNEQSRLEAEIAALENDIRTAIVIDGDVSTESVNVGTTVKVLFVEDGDEDEFSIVGAREADPMNNRISNESPIGAALLGHKVGETVQVDAPEGMYPLKVLEIRV